jgi:predicted SnoaL-like aldol condensation-catalyzing enzyme
VRCRSEGELAGEPSAFYDLFRVETSQLVEHWDVISPIPAEMAHSNGKFWAALAERST